jgi:hypothetical protein
MVGALFAASTAAPASTRLGITRGALSSRAAKSAKPLTKTQYTAQANALCDAAATASAAFGPHFTQATPDFVSIVQHQIDRTRALVPPTHDQPKMQKFLAVNQDALNLLKTHPNRLGRKPSPFSTADVLARAYGLEGAAGSGVCTGQGSTSPLRWSAPQQIDTNQDGLFEVSCPSVTFCVAVGSTGPGTVGSALLWNGTSWSASTTQIFAQNTYNHISCPSTNFCMAGAPNGGALIWNGTSWSASPQIRWPDPNDGITFVSCGSSSFCAGADEDGDIRVWDGTSWSIDHPVVPGTTSGGARSISCPSASFCMAVNELGNAIVWNGTSLSAPTTIDSNGHVVAVSCPSPSFCMALGGGDTWMVYNGASWSAPRPIGTLRPGGRPPPPPPRGRPRPRSQTPPPTTPSSTPAVFINFVSCPTASFCVAALSDGEAIVWNGTAWSAPQSIDSSLANARGPAAQTTVGSPSLGLKAVSCPTPSFCVAVGSDGSATIGRVAS